MTAVAAIALSACSSSPNTAGTTTTTSASGHNGQGTTTTSGATTSTTSSTTSTTTGTGSTCQTADLAFSVGQGNGAAGQIEQTIVMRNTSTKSCTLSGYPGMQLYDSSQTPIPTNVVRGGQTFAVAAANAPAAPVTLAPGASASFTLHYSDVPVGNETSCPLSASAHITPPNDVASATVALQIDPCSGGTVHVSPVYAS